MTVKISLIGWFLATLIVFAAAAVLLVFSLGIGQIACGVIFGI